jgi:hypothetical protein
MMKDRPEALNNSLSRDNPKELIENVNQFVIERQFDINPDKTNMF